MSARTFTCQGCGKTGPLTNPHDRRRKWCSDRCRKQTLYGGTCIDCGAPTNGSDGRGPHAAERCVSCAAAINGTRLRARWEPERRDDWDRLAEMYLAGASLSEIAAEFGWTHRGTVSRALWNLRNRHGYDLPHRYAIVDGRRVAA
jgi:hypothetical protein